MSPENKTGATTKATRHRFYGTKRWDRLRTQALVRDQYICQACGRVEHKSRLHAHHVTPHHGDAGLFFNINNIRTLCQRCHDGEARDVERLGYSRELDRDGYPVDERHPFRRGN